jgi:hypothetical protein|tara:strand:- start:1472 stop:1627 length:156 start_codon:yes stop_codon:yes gene_type:complete
MAWYKCVQTGNKVEFTEQIDIEAMKRHHGYELVEDGKKEVKAKKSIFNRKD